MEYLNHDKGVRSSRESPILSYLSAQYKAIRVSSSPPTHPWPRVNQKESRTWMPPHSFQSIPSAPAMPYHIQHPTNPTAPVPHKSVHQPYNTTAHRASHQPSYTRSCQDSRIQEARDKVHTTDPARSTVFCTSKAPS